MKNKSLNFLIILLLLSSIAFIACESGGSSDGVSVDYLPSLGGSATGGARVVLPATCTFEQGMYVIMSPLLYEFKANDSGVKMGDSFVENSPILGDVTFTLTEVDGVLNFYGVNADDSIRIYVEYNPSTKKFSYEQYVYLNDTNKIFNDDPAEDGQKMILWNSFSDVTLNDDLTFQTNFSSISISDLPEYTQKQFQAVNSGELYRGELTPGVIGTGIAVRDGYGDFSSTDFSFLPGSTDLKPATIADLSNLDLIENYIRTTGITPFVDGTPGYFNEIFFGEKADTVTSLKSPDGDDTLATFLSLYPSSWKSNTLINE